MLVARALAAAKNPGNACIENSLSQYQVEASLGAVGANLAKRRGSR
jgi:hypothetical protein